MDAGMTDIGIQWIGQGGFIFTFGDKKICIDPYLSNSVAKEGKFNRIVPLPIKPDELKVDMIVCSHDHKDHLDEETIKYTDFDNTIYTGPTPCLEHFKEIGIKEDQLRSLNIGERVRFENIVLEGVYADHSPGSIGLVIEFEGRTIYMVADSRYNEKLMEVGSFNPDVLITCINGKMGNMDYREAARLAQGLGVKAALPCHYGMFEENTEDPNKFRRELEGTGITYIELEYNKAYLFKEDLQEVSVRG